MCLFCSTTDDSLDQYIRDILELLKAMMPTGIPDCKQDTSHETVTVCLKFFTVSIPPLDPFEVPQFDIPHIEEDIIKVDIAVTDLVIRNLSTFQTTQAHFDLENLSLELGLLIPDLRVSKMGIYSSFVSF